MDTGAVNIQWLLTLANDPVGLGVFVFGLVSSVKRADENNKPPVMWNPWIWRGLSLVAGVLLSLLLHLVTGKAVLLLTGWSGALVFGLVVGVIAITGRDGLKTVLSWLGGATPTTAPAPNITVNQPPATVAVTVPPVTVTAPEASPQGTPAAQTTTVTIERPGQGGLEPIR